MADDGMLLNFEFGDAPLKTQVKFKGGRWRDRIRAQKGARDAKPIESKRSVTRDDGQFTRPAKRLRLGDAEFAKSTSGDRRDINAYTRTGQVTSKLFTSNPTAETVFEDQPAEETEQSTTPSNAPLSEEAENFLALGLSRRIAHHLSSKLEMKAPTAIQKSTIPQLVAEDNDAFLQAETGSGKTLAYLLPIVQRIMALSHAVDGTNTGKQIHRDSGLFAIILAPTRELCKQIATVMEKVLRCAPWLVSTTVIGGESKKSEKARLRKGVNILIATPGRLTDHLDNTKVLDVGTVRWLVLDEGDRMMEMGFEDDLRTIVGKIRKDELRNENKDGVVLSGVLPSRRVTVLCSATMKMNVQKLGEISLQDAVHITAARSDADKDGDGAAINESVFTAPSQLKQTYLIVPAKLRLVTLIALLKSAFARRGSVMKAIVFISCADSVDFHFELLKGAPGAPAPPPPKDTPQPKDKASSLTDATVAPAAYITSPANPAVTLHKLHGSLAQPVRTSTLHSFTSSKDPSVLITTDISSRGLDVPAVDLVVEYDPAFAVSDHVHRIGRTARAGRPGKAVLFLQPGSEEGYASLLGTPGPAPQLYDEVLRKGLASAVALPPTDPPQPPPPERQPYTARAEHLQLHLEQRVLQRAPGPARRDGPLLEAARLAFRSHVRAYATHVREERVYFDLTRLHLGHMAKAFGLRETPGGIGGGVGRRTPQQGGGGRGQKRKASGGADGGGGGGGGGRDDDHDVGGVDQDAARRMKEKMRAVMSKSSEFNIG